MKLISAFALSIIITSGIAAGCGQVSVSQPEDPGVIQFGSGSTQSQTNDITDIIAPGDNDDRAPAPAPGNDDGGGQSGSEGDGSGSASHAPQDEAGGDGSGDSGSGNGNGSGVSAGAPDADAGASVAAATDAAGQQGGNGGTASSPQDSSPAAAEDEIMDISREMLPLTASPAMFRVDFPSAPGTQVKENEKAEIDYSNTRDGYVMIRFLQSTNKELRVIITGPSNVQYIYILKRDGSWEIFPLSDGNGSYTISVFEQTEGNRYATANSLTTQVTLTDQFAPFLRPNQYVNFTSGSRTVAKAAEIVAGESSFRERVSHIYGFVISHLSYDRELAMNIRADYLPDLDSVLARGKGICFDYAALMTAMLRSLGIPTKLVVGYAGDAYHAWINVYSEATGWLNSVIFFDGQTWNLMDPTFASSANQSADVMQFIGTGSNYRAMFLY